MYRQSFAVLFTIVGLVAACSNGPKDRDTGPWQPEDTATEDAAGDVATDTATPDTASPDTGTAPDPDSSTPDPDTGADVADGGSTDTSGADGASGDTGPDCDTDSDSDGLNDCEEARICTDPNDGDTDGDNLSDYEELQHQTDPCDPDTDGDGATDKEEIDHGLDPNRPNEDLWPINACDNPEAEPVDFHKNATGNWTLALPPNFANYKELSITNTNPPVAAAVYDDPATAVAGGLVSMNAPSNQSAPTDALRGVVKEGLGQVGRVIQDQTGGAFETHDGKTAAVGQFMVDVSPTTSVRRIREQLLLQLAPFSKDQVSGLPTTAGTPHRRFRVFVSVIKRNRPSGRDQHLVAIAISPNKKYQTLDQAQFRMDDLTNTTNIAEQVDTHLVKCETFEAPETSAKAEFYWVLDQSGSMDDDNQKVADFAEQFEDKVSNTTLDYRMGVTNMDKDNHGHLRTPPAWHTDGKTFRQEINEAVIGCTRGSVKWECSGANEHGLTAAVDGIEYMTGNAQATPTPAERARSNSSIITIFMSDEETNVIKANDHTPYEKTLTSYKNFFTGRTTAFSIVADGSADCPMQDGRSYKDIALATGGKFASLCSENLNQIIRDIIIASVGETSQFALRRTPISSSLRVYLNGTWVPRSREDGFEYFEENNSIGFFGSYRPTPQNEDEGTPDYVAVSYETFKDRCKRADSTTCTPDDE